MIADASTSQKEEAEEAPSEADTDPDRSTPVETDPADADTSGDSGNAPINVAPADTDPADSSAPVADTSTDSTLETESTPLKLKLEYDDRYTFDVEGYTIQSVKTETVSSYQVSGGSVTRKKDTAVLTRSSDTEVIATGVGTATVVLAPDRSLQTSADVSDVPAFSAAEEPAAEEALQAASNTITYTVTVEPAILTMMFVAGQSNAAGYCGSGRYAYSSVVPCEPGTVYSSFGARTALIAERVTNISSTIAEKHTVYLKTDSSNARDLLPSSLTSSTKSASGKTLYYPLNGLTSDVTNRKTGLDAGLAYRWHELTGDKVWVVNAAVGGTSINRWDPDSTSSSTSYKLYPRALKFFQAADKIMKAEVDAGHYKPGRRLMFWLQGEQDYALSVSSYLKQFRKTANAFRRDLKVTISGKTHSLYALGIITTRACMNFSNDSGVADLVMTGPRRAQYGLGYSRRSGSSYNDQFIYVVSNANEQWATDAGVVSYFQSKYPSGTLTYPTGYRNGKNTYASLPTAYQSLKPDKHYTQLGHNENGITAAEGMYRALTSQGGSPSSVSWVNAAGVGISSLACTAGKTAVAIAQTEPISSAKKVTFTTDGEYCTYNSLTGVISGTKPGQGWIKVTCGGKTLSTLSVSVKSLASPTLTSVSNGSRGISVKWKTVSGAASYRIYRKSGSGSWTRVGDTTSNSFTDKSAKSGTTYTYTVRCLSSDGKSFTSGYDATGKTTCYLSPVTLSGVSNVQGKKIKLRWKKDANANGYQIQYSTDKSFKTGITTKTVSKNTTTSATCSGLSKGKTCYVRIRSYRQAKQATYYSSWSTRSVKITK